MSEVTEKIADYSIIDLDTNKKLHYINEIDDFPFGKLMRMEFILFNLMLETEYYITVFLNGQTVSMTRINIHEENFKYVEIIDSIRYGKAVGSFDFNFFRDKKGSVEVTAALYKNMDEGPLHKFSKYYFFTDDANE